MTISAPGQAARTGGYWRDFRRLVLFTVKRVLALLLTVLVGVYLTSVIANMGGKVDELRLVQIRSNAAWAEKGGRARPETPAPAPSGRVQAKA